MTTLDRIESGGLKLAFEMVPWDTAACGFPVAQLTGISVTGDPQPTAAKGWRAFESWRDRMGAGLVSCRLPENQLRESIWLEGAGFRFVEMVMQPETLLARTPGIEDPGLEISAAGPGDLDGIGRIAEQAFVTDRFSLDFRLPPGVSGRRYRQWVESVPSHATQRLLKVEENGCLIGFFVVEPLANGTCLWHLTAVAPDYQHQGYGKRIWRAMLARHSREGMDRVLTTIAVRNAPVVNLYAGLGFRFHPPQMTLHWVRD